MPRSVHTYASLPFSFTNARRAPSVAVSSRSPRSARKETSESSICAATTAKGFVSPLGISQQHQPSASVNPSPSTTLFAP